MHRKTAKPSERSLAASRLGALVLFDMTARQALNTLTSIRFSAAMIQRLLVAGILLACALLILSGPASSPTTVKSLASQAEVRNRALFAQLYFCSY